MVNKLFAISIVVGAFFVHLDASEGQDELGRKIYLHPEFIGVDEEGIFVESANHKISIETLHSDENGVYTVDPQDLLLNVLDTWFPDAYWECPDCHETNARGDEVCAATEGCWGEPESAEEDDSDEEE